MKRNLLFLFIMVSVLNLSEAQTNTLPIQEFGYNVIFAKTQLSIIAKGAYHVYSDRELKNKIGTVRNKEMILCDFIPVDRNQLFGVDVIKVESKKYNGFINPFETRNYRTLQVEIRDWLAFMKETHKKDMRNRRKTFLVNKYGDELGWRLTNLKLRKGMSEEMVRDALGIPTTITEGFKGKSLFYKNMFTLNSEYGYSINLKNFFVFFKKDSLSNLQYDRF